MDRVGKGFLGVLCVEIQQAHCKINAAYTLYPI